MVVILTTAGLTLAAALMTADDSSMVTGCCCWLPAAGGVGGDHGLVERAGLVEHDDRAARGQHRREQRGTQDHAHAGTAPPARLDRRCRLVPERGRRGSDRSAGGRRLAPTGLRARAGPLAPAAARARSTGDSRRLGGRRLIPALPALLAAWCGPCPPGVRAWIGGGSVAGDLDPLGVVRGIAAAGALGSGRRGFVVHEWADLPSCSLDGPAAV